MNLIKTLIALAAFFGALPVLGMFHIHDDITIHRVSDIINPMDMKKPYVAFMNYEKFPCKVVEFNRVVGSKDEPIQHNLAEKPYTHIEEKDCGWNCDLYFDLPTKGYTYIASINKPGLYVIARLSQDTNNPSNYNYYEGLYNKYIPYQSDQIIIEKYNNKERNSQ